MSKKTTFYGSEFVTKGVAYVRHHIGDRLISDKVISSRNEFNERFWIPFRNSSYRNFFEFLKDNLTSKQMLDLTANDKRQIIWCCGISPTIKTSSLIVMLAQQYKKLDSLPTSVTYYVCYSSKFKKTSDNDNFLALAIDIEMK